MARAVTHQREVIEVVLAHQDGGGHGGLLAVWRASRTPDADGPWEVRTLPFGGPRSERAVTPRLTLAHAILQFSLALRSAGGPAHGGG